VYVTAHRVVRPETGEEGINAFLHIHGPDFSWPTEPWLLPENNPGRTTGRQVGLAPGGNRVRSYLDLLAPDETPAAEISAALTGLWLELVADEALPEIERTLPNPVVYERGPVVIRFGVEGGLRPGRLLELNELRRFVDPFSAAWEPPD